MYVYKHLWRNTDWQENYAITLLQKPITQFRGFRGPYVAGSPPDVRLWIPEFS